MFILQKVLTLETKKEKEILFAETETQVCMYPCQVCARDGGCVATTIEVFGKRRRLESSHH